MSVHISSNKRNSLFKLIDNDHLNDYYVNYRDMRGSDVEYNHSELKSKTNIDGTDIMNWTGPGLFTDIIFEYMNNLIRMNDDIIIFNPNLNGDDNSQDKTETTKKFNEKITKSLGLNTIPWEFFSLITNPVIIDDIMVLPITSFSPEAIEMGAKTADDESALVVHLFEGSWKDEKKEENENKDEDE